MKYNEDYNKWFSKEGLCFKYDKKQDKLIRIELTPNSQGRLKLKNVKLHKPRFLHRAIWETFVYSIPDGYEIDHINGDRLDNRLCNLRCVKHIENMRNPITLHRIKELVNSSEYKEKQRKSHTGKRKPRSEFNNLFYEHYGIRPADSVRLYGKLYAQWRRTGSCKWEVVDTCN